MDTTPIYGQHSERYTSHNGCIYRTYDRQGTWAAGRVINLIIPVWWLYLYGTCLYIILIEETLLQMKSNFSFNHDSVKSFKTLLINLTSTLMSLFNYGITNGRRRFNNILHIKAFTGTILNNDTYKHTYESTQCFISDPFYYVRLQTHNDMSINQ